MCVVQRGGSASCGGSGFIVGRAVVALHLERSFVLTFQHLLSLGHHGNASVLLHLLLQLIALRLLDNCPTTGHKGDTESKNSRVRGQ